jgi:hypothetical protein
MRVYLAGGVCIDEACRLVHERLLPARQGRTCSRSSPPSTLAPSVTDANAEAG